MERSEARKIAEAIMRRVGPAATFGAGAPGAGKPLPVPGDRDRHFVAREPGAREMHAVPGSA